MDHYEEVIALFQALADGGKNSTPVAVQPTHGALKETLGVGISNRHLHLTEGDLTALFGPGYELTHIKDLTQPGQFACKETVTVVGPKGAIEKVRVLGPVRPYTQVELLAGDCVKLGIPAVIRMSGDLDGTPGLTVVGPKGAVTLNKGGIVAQRHIHMTPADAAEYGVRDGQVVSIEIDTPRGGRYDHVIIRANNQSALDCHIDIEEANAMQMTAKTTVRIVK